MFCFYEISKRSSFHEKEKQEQINVFTQFFMPKNEARLNEIRECLKRNVLNECINKIYLLNEKIYTKEELGIESSKIVQENIERRIKFSDIFNYVLNHKIEGYIVIINSDIFLDETIEKIQNSNLRLKRTCYTLLRYEYRNETNLNDCSLFGSKDFYKKEFERQNPVSMFTPNLIQKYDFDSRCDSMDTWIFHSNNFVEKKEIKTFDFFFGTPGCDNKIIYLLKVCGYDIYNDPKHLRTYHYHCEPFRNYTIKDRIQSPYGLLIPAQFDYEKTMPFMGKNTKNILKTTNNLSYCHFTDDNCRLKDYIINKIKKDEHFIIPRIAGVENNNAYYSKLIQSGKLKKNIEQYLRLNVMKNNAGIKITSMDSLNDYSNKYLDAFKKCEMYAVWENWGDVYKYISDSHDYITSTFKKEKIWAFSFDIYHYLHNPWTHALRGKRLLIISPFIDSIKLKIDNRKEIYGVDLFPECEFVFIKPPQTQGDEPSQEFNIELDKFKIELEKIKDTFDIALVSCGGYGNLVCSLLYDMKRSAIYIGGVLQMYFGIYGKRWMRERKDILNMHLNNNWTRPGQLERPRSFEKVEDSCYW
jgi:hypothetical protein